MADPPVAAPRPVLVLYAPADEAFVRGYFVPALGRAEAVIEARELATVALDELEQALQACSVAVAVISRAFLADPWARLSELLASGAAVERDLAMIPLVLETCALPLHIREKVCLDFRYRAEWDDQAKRLRDHLARPAPVEAPLPCPYPGMRPFEAGDAKYFHGRAAEIAAVVALVAAGERELYLVGPSGSGKSSLIAAGVVPRLAALPGAPELVVRTMRPGDAPIGRLAACLEADAPDAGAVAAWATRHPGAQLVVVVDQLEELFTLASADEQAGFAAALGALRAEPRCLLVLAVRADFYAELMQSQLWLDGRRRHVDLPPLRGTALRAAIERPARALDVYLERELIERLLGDTAGEPGVLPLLQETLVQLWSRRRRRRLLTLAEYEALGDHGRSGLAVAISSRADRCLRELTAAQVVIARRLLLRLVSFGEGRPNTRRRQTRAQLAAGEPAAAFDEVLRQLVAARLVTMDGDGRAIEDQVDLCHEVLITTWPSFATWVEARRADELRRRQIQASADEWIARGRGASGLLDPGELAAALAWRQTDAARELGESPEVTALVDASRAAIELARRRRRRWIASVVAGLAVFAAVTGTLAIIARGQATVAEAERGKAEAERRNAERERGNAVRMLGEQYREMARQALVDRAYQRAVPYLVAAREHGVDDVGLRAMFRIATTSWVAVALPHRDAVASVRFAAGDTRIVTASFDGTARVWDAGSGAPVTPPLVHARPVSYAELAPDGAQVLTISDDHTAWIWDLAVRPPRAVALRHAGAINTARFSGDGTTVVTASTDRTARLWSARTGAPLGPPLQHDAPVWTAEIDRDATRVVTTTTEGTTAGIWNARTGARIASLRQAHGTLAVVDDPRIHVDLVWSAAFSSDGARVVTTSADNTARIWDAASGTTIGAPMEHAGGVVNAVFSPDGARIATIGNDARIRIWDVARAAIVGPVLEQPSRVLYLEYSRDGTRLVVQCNDTIVRIWDLASGAVVAAIDLESGARDAAISADGLRVVTASADGLARVWRVGSVAPRVIQTGARFYDAVYSADGTRIAITDNRAGVRVRSAAGALEVERAVALGNMTVAFDRAGEQLAVISRDGAARLGPLQSPSWPVPRAGPGEAHQPDGPPAAHDRAIIHATAPGAFSPDGRRFATTAAQHSARIWDTTTGRPATPHLMHDAAVLTVRFSPDGRRVVTAGRDGTARIWDAGTGASLGPVLSHPADKWVMFAAFSPDGSRIVTTCGDNNVRLWDAASHRLAATLTGHGARITGAAFSRDGALLLTSSDDRTARIWNVATGALAAPLLEHASRVESAAFSPDAARVVTASATRVQVWDVRTGRPLGPPLEHPDFVRSAMFSPDGASVLTAGNDAVRIWDVGLDAGSLADWRRIAGGGAYPRLAEALERLEAGSRVTR